MENVPDVVSDKNVAFAYLNCNRSCLNASEYGHLAGKDDIVIFVKCAVRLSENRIYDSLKYSNIYQREC